MVFGDVFRQRGDYSKGLFYSGRNGIFDQNNKVQKSGIPQLINKEQYLSPRDPNLITNTNTTTTTANLATYTSVPHATELPPIVAPQTKSYTNMLKVSAKKDHQAELDEIRRRRRQRLGTVIIDQPLEEWKEEEYGGVKVWVDNTTGEVSVNRPLEWKKKAESRQSIVGNLPSLRIFRKTNRIAIDNGPTKKENSSASIRSIRASGRTVYHNQEMKELMEMFDAGRSSRRISNVIARKVATLK